MSYINNNKNDATYKFNANSYINEEQLTIFINKNLSVCQTSKDLLTIIRNEVEIKNILLY